MAELERMVPRVVDADSSSQLFTMAHLIESIPAPLDKVDAVIVMPGLGEHVRLIAAVNAWEAHKQTRHLLVAGTNDIETTQPQPSLDYLKGEPVFLRRTNGVVAQVAAEHTRDQTEWLVDQLQPHSIKSAALFVTHWHLPRAYGTLLKSMLDRELKIPVFPVAVGTSPDAIVPETQQTVSVMSAGEAQRIVKYQGLGHVASLAELHDNLAWLWKQDIAPVAHQNVRHA